MTTSILLLMIALALIVAITVIVSGVKGEVTLGRQADWKYQTPYASYPTSTPSQREDSESGEPSRHASGARASMTQPESEVVCPRCGAEIVQQVAKRGTNSGEIFRACTNHPACRGAGGPDMAKMPFGTPH